MNKVFQNFCILLLIICLVFVSNTSIFYSFMANLNFAMNNNFLAQEYAEKVFNAGIKDKKLGEKYFNSINKDYIDLQDQQKIVKLLEYNLSDSLKTKIENLLDNIKEKIDDQYPDNFVAKSVYNQKIMRWNKFPITYVYLEPQKVSKEIKDQISLAFDEWENSTNKQITFRQIEDENADIKIRFLEHNPADKNDYKYIIAYTSPTVFNDELKSMDINFYTKNIEGKNFTQNQIYNTALHEIAHALGFMGHSEKKIDIMYFSSNSILHHENKKDMLSLGDISTLKLLYKIKPDITNYIDNSSEYLPIIVLGSKKEINSIKFQEAKSYINKAPELPNGYMDLAEVYLQIKQYSKALKNLKLALNYANSDEIKDIIYYNLSIVAFHMEDFELAKNYLLKSINLKNTFEKEFLLTQIYIKNNEEALAIDLLNTLIEKAPENIEYTIALANVYLTKKQFFNARKVIKNYLKNNPNDSDNKRLYSYGILRY